MSLQRWPHDERGFALTLVLITSILVGLIGVGVLSVVMSDLHGAVANQLAMQVLNVAEAGVNYEISELYAKATETPTPPCGPDHSNDECWSGPGSDLSFGPGTFRVVVQCTDGSAPTSTGCAVDSDVRHIVSTGTVGRARRQVEILVRRQPAGGAFANFCGKDGIRLDQGTTITADVASNQDISVEGPRRNPGTIQAKDNDIAAPPSPAGLTLNGIPHTPIGLTGSYSWKVTFVANTGAESSGSPVTASVALSNQNSYLTSIPLGGGTIVKRRVYRTRAGQAGTGPWFFVGEISDNVTQQYRDARVDAELVLPLATSASPPAPSDAPTAAPDSQAPAEPAGLTGAYTYKVTYVYRYQGSATAQIESVGSSPASPDPVPLPLTDQYVKLTNIPQTTDPDILKRRLYRTTAGGVGPWFFVAEIAASNDDLDDLDPSAGIERGYIDKRADAELAYPAPRAISGNAVAGGEVNCSQGCATQVDGEVREHAREVVCPPFLPPTCNPDSNPNNDAPLTITQTTDPQTLRYDELHPAAAQRVTIKTPDDPNAQLHIHVRSVMFERDAVLAISGRGRVYFHVASTFRLGQRSWFGVDDNAPGSLLVWPGDRVQILSCASDPPYETTGTASVRWDQQNRVAALVFAPNANILINQAGEFSGGLLGQYIHINQGLGYVLDPGSGINPGDARSPYQIIERWYDNPRF